MQLRSWYLVGFSVVLGLGAAWVASQWIEQRTNLADASNVGIKVAVASEEVPYGTTIKSDQVRYLAVPKGTDIHGYFTDVNMVIGKVAKQQLFSGEIILKEKITEPGVGSTLAVLIKPQMRAVTVRVDDVVGVAGFLLPGNHVDVMAARIVHERATTETILSDINVLAVDQTSGAGKNEPVIVRAVTLEVSPDQAEILMRAREEGHIQLTLRNPNDSTIVERVTQSPVDQPIDSEPSQESMDKPAVVKSVTKPVKKKRAATLVVAPSASAGTGDVSQVYRQPDSSVTVIRGTYINDTPIK